jgi:hypothetical protein
MHKPEAEPKRYSPFWVCLFVFLAIGVQSGISLNTLVDFRKQLNDQEAFNEKNATALAQTFAQGQQTLAQGQELKVRLDAFALDLINMASTNAAARQIVQEFQIQWNPPPQPQPQPQPTPKS